MKPNHLSILPLLAFLAGGWEIDTSLAASGRQVSSLREPTTLTAK
jgi:hypothetical protein